MICKLVRTTSGAGFGSEAVIEVEDGGSRHFPRVRLSEILHSECVETGWLHTARTNAFSGVYAHICMDHAAYPEPGQLNTMTEETPVLSKDISSEFSYKGLKLPHPFFPSVPTPLFNPFPHSLHPL